MTLIVHADVTDPLGRVAAVRVDALRAAGEEVEWRAVASRHSTRVLASPAGPEWRRRLGEAERWHRDNALPGEELRWVTPLTVPCPDAPVSALAEAAGAGIADHVRHLLLTAYWDQGLDIGNPDVLRPLLVLPMLHGSSGAEVLRQDGYAVAIGGGPVTTDAWRRIGAWRRSWVDLGRPALPALVEDGTILSGFEALARLGALVSERGLEVRLGADPFPLPPRPVTAPWLGIEYRGHRSGWWRAAASTDRVGALAR